MRNILTLAQRELAAYFLSPLAYVIMTAFLFFVGVVFYQTLTETPDSESMRDLLGGISFITLFIMPMLTMRLLAEEKRSGTLEMLMTAPVTESEIVLAKFLGGLIFYILLIIPTFAYVILLVAWGKPDLGALIAWYSGLILMAAAFVALGLFVSSFSNNQLVAAIITFILLLVGWWIIPWTAATVSGGIVSFLNLILGWLVGKLDNLTTTITEVFQYLGIVKHLITFAKGLIDSRDVVYFISVTVLFLFLSVRVVESRRWK
jgi:ABC-2 type transport system permease protein